LQVLYQGIGPTILAILFFLRAVERLGAERTGVMIGLVPIISGLAAVPLLGEPLKLPLIIGMVLVSAGTYFAARPPRKKALTPLAFGDARGRLQRGNPQRFQRRGLGPMSGATSFS